MLKQNTHSIELLVNRMYCCTTVALPSKSAQKENPKGRLCYALLYRNIIPPTTRRQPVTHRSRLCHLCCRRTAVAAEALRSKTGSWRFVQNSPFTNSSFPRLHRESAQASVYSAPDYDDEGQSTERMFSPARASNDSGGAGVNGRGNTIVGTTVKVAQTRVCRYNNNEVDPFLRTNTIIQYSTEHCCKGTTVVGDTDTGVSLEQQRNRFVSAYLCDRTMNNRQQYSCTRAGQVLTKITY